ncbi:HD-GYP domain-containing protein [Geothermobacter hydrogeniphilus]|uniref:Phosphohydrolase n=1 Tax=Geothermobacter hydrogeniphilus TaxID=1969733 RepID=A0A1X0YDZ8_9BACT|nr:HD domain-containing phosphohydrolase [Geothermobacter hydrogeniphilus]ORJ63322.1 phosphohydrolase [Geothermobacter hydrogeniphilus]
MQSAALYNSRIIDTYLKLLRARYPDVDCSAILQYAGMEPYETADQGHWFSQQQIDLFYEKCVQLTGNENIAREAGRFAASPGTLGAMRQYGLSLAGPLKAFSLIGTSTRKFTRSSDYSFRKISNTRVEVVVTTRPGVAEKHFQCDNRVGFFEAIINGFNVGAPKIEHPECMFRGGRQCRYLISWKHNRTTILKRFRDAVLLSVAVVVPATFVVAPGALKTVLAAGLIAGLFVSWLVEHVRARDLEQGMAQHWETSDQLADQIEQNYRNTKMAAAVGDVIANRTSISEVIDSVVHALEKTLDYDRGLILLANEQTGRLEICGAYGYVEQFMDLLTGISFNLNNPDSRGMFVVSFRQQKPLLINDVDKIQDSLSPKSREFLQALKTRSFLCVPIVLEGKSIGILAVDNLESKKPLLVSDVNLLMGIAPSIALSIQNARLLETRAAQFDSTLQVLADSIDARDFLTAGHSEKVAEYSVGIAREMGLNEEYCHVIRRAALLHDYGKIGIPDSILKKSGPLSEEERAVIRTHPTRTRQILEKVAFEGLYADIPEICHAHHEKWDGTGYPNALKGEEIPLGARIIAAADFFEAITADRHYREPMDISTAREIFLAESGKHFQPEVVSAFIRYLERVSLCMLPEEQGKVPVSRHPWGHLKQRRAGYRTEVSVKVARKVITGTSVHIGPEEIYINSHEVGKLAENDEVAVTFALPARQGLIQLHGKVVVINSEPRPDLLLPAGFTVHFSSLDSKTRQVLSHYVDGHPASRSGPSL